MNNFYFSVPRCSCDDFYWFRIFDDFLEKIWSHSCIPQHVGIRGVSPMGTFGLWMDPFTLWNNLLKFGQVRIFRFQEGVCLFSKLGFWLEEIGAVNSKEVLPRRSNGQVLK